MVCEELGLIGACVVMLIFALLVLRGFWVALHARDRFGSLLAVGVTTQISLQVFLNIAVVTGVSPPPAFPSRFSATAARRWRCS